MHVNDIWDIFAGLMIIAVIAVILTKPNTANDVNAAGNAFSGALKQAQAG